MVFIAPSKKQNRNYSEAHALCNLGSYYLDRANLARAEDYFKQCLSITLNFMRNIFLIASLAIASLVFFGASPVKKTEPQAEINWITIEEAIQLAENGTDKKFFIDVYTDWCGWCKRMDKTTFSDPEVSKHMNDNFYCVKLDADKTSGYPCIHICFNRWTWVS